MKGQPKVLIQRMAFLQRDPKAGTSQVLFLLRSGHDLELECQVQNENGQLVGDPIRLAYTLSDALANQLDKHKPNTEESHRAWREVLEMVLLGNVIRNGFFVPQQSVLIGLSVIATFGEPCWQIDERLSIVDRNMNKIVHVHRRKAGNVSS